MSAAQGHPLQEAKGEPNGPLRPWNVTLTAMVSVAVAVALILAAGSLVSIRVGTLFPNQEHRQVKPEAWRAAVVCTGNKRRD